MKREIQSQCWNYHRTSQTQSFERCVWRIGHGKMKPLKIFLVHITRYKHHDIFEVSVRWHITNVDIPLKIPIKESFEIDLFVFLIIVKHWSFIIAPLRIPHTHSIYATYANIALIWIWLKEKSLRFKQSLHFVYSLMFIRIGVWVIQVLIATLTARLVDIAIYILQWYTILPAKF